jgi:CRISPR-associated endonuclease/helicase Cas3
LRWSCDGEAKSFNKDIAQDVIYYAHSTSSVDHHDWEPLRAHLEAVAAGTAKRAEKFGANRLGHIAGLLHDLGKYTEAFQARLSGSTQRVDHAAPGARAALNRYGPHIGKLLAFGIAGHHTGLADATSSSTNENPRTPLNDRLRQIAEITNDILAAAVSDGLAVPNAVPSPDFRGRDELAGFQFSVLGRMLFSCLVDADYIETELFYASVENRKLERSDFPSLDALAIALDKHLAGIAAGVPDTPINRLRAEVLAHVRDKASEPAGVFTLTVPTGGGKTLASLAFALNHAKRHGLDRAIFVIPFTSIVDQTASVYRAAAITIHGRPSRFARWVFSLIFFPSPTFSRPK